MGWFPFLQGVINALTQGGPTDNDNKGGGLDNDRDYQEWKVCNEQISRLDSILIDLRKFGFSVATGLTTAGSILGLAQFNQFQPFQIVLIFATMALIDVLYWLDVYYQTVISAVILRTQVLERKLHFGLDTYISRFYMRHKIGKGLHMLHVGFLTSLLILGAYVIYSNDLVSKSGISLPVWILFLLVPIFFILAIWFFFDRRRYKTYREAQEKISNFLRNPSVCVTPDEGRSIDQEIIEFLDSDKEDLGLDLESDEWVYFHEIELRWWLRFWSWSRRLIVTNRRIYAIKTNCFWKWIAPIELSNIGTKDESVRLEKVPNDCHSLRIMQAHKEYFKMKISEGLIEKDYRQEIIDRIYKIKKDKDDKEKQNLEDMNVLSKQQGNKLKDNYQEDPIID